MRWLFLLLLAWPLWAAESPQAQTLTLIVTRTPYGELALEVLWDAYGPELRPGEGWVTVGARVRVPATIRRLGTGGAEIHSQSPLLVRELVPALAPMVCGGKGTLSLKVRDLFCNEVEWQAPAENIHWQPGPLEEELQRMVCGPETWATIPAGSTIPDIETFLSTCPSPEALTSLGQGFPLLFQPPQLAPKAVSSCGETLLSAEQLLVYQALNVIRHMKLEDPLPWTSLHPYQWLEEKIDAIVINLTTPGSFCCVQVRLPDLPTPGMAIVLARSEERLWPHQLSWHDPNTETRVVQLVLEIVRLARALERPSDCGPKDSSLEYMGPWGAAYTLAQRMAAGTIQIGLSPQQREALATYAQQLLSSRFCH